MFQCPISPDPQFPNSPIPQFTNPAMPTNRYPVGHRVVPVTSGSDTSPQTVLVILERPLSVERSHSLVFSCVTESGLKTPGIEVSKTMKGGVEFTLSNWSSAAQSLVNFTGKIALTADLLHARLYGRGSQEAMPLSSSGSSSGSNGEPKVCVCVCVALNRIKCVHEHRQSVL